MTHPANDAQIRVAVYPSWGLGDALLFLILAQNLANQGFRVTLFSDVIVALDAFFPDFSIQKNNAQPLDDGVFDFVFAEKVSLPVNLPHAAERFAFLSMSSLPDALKPADPSVLLNHVASEKKDLLKPLIAGAGVSLKHHYRGKSAVEALTLYCRDFLQLKQVMRKPKLSSVSPVSLRESDCHPEQEIPRSAHNDRTAVIAIHPTSSNAQKNWPARKYCRLAKRLLKKGYQPIFILTQDERALWRRFDLPEACTPAFSGLDAIFAFLSEATVFVGNDSGIGHLASLAGVPTITLTYIQNTHYFWRPDWSPNIWLASRWYFKCFGRVVWKPFLTVSRVSRCVSMAVFRLNK